MGQKHGRQNVQQNQNVMASPVFAVDKVRGAKGGFSVTSRYHVNRSLRQDYKVERCILGSGASGPVHLAKFASEKKGNRQFAVKSFRKRGLTPEAKKELRGEVEVYLKLDHPHVARLEDVYETDRELHLVMELMSGGELYARLAQRRHYSEADAAQTCRQMLLAIAYLHAHSIVHRDLKLENFLYERQDTEHLKLIDFGFAKYHERGSGKMSRSCGSLHYIAPEVLRHSYDEKADMWSLGVIVYMLLTGNPPFYGSTDEKCLYRIQRGEPSFSKRWWKLSGGAQTFVLSLLALDPEARPSAADALKRPWICMVETPKVTIDGEVLSSLRSFAHSSHFRRACLSMMAWSLTLEDQLELRQQFQLLDTNKSGTISQHELARVLQANFNIDSAETEALFKGLDTKGSKEIGYAEFLAAAMKKRMCMHEDVLHATFERFDVQGTGEITTANLRALLGDSFEGSDVEELIREADCDGDGRVSYADFLSYLQDGDAELLDSTTCETPRAVADDTVPKTIATASATLNEQSTRFRARKEFTEIIDGICEGGEDQCMTRPPLTPKHPKPASPPKQRKVFVGDSSSSRASPQRARSTGGLESASRKPSSDSATATPPVATSPDGSKADVTVAVKTGQLLETSGMSLQPVGDPAEPTRGGLLAGKDSEASEPFVQRTMAEDGDGTDSNRRRHRWQQCVRPLTWPPWRRRTSEE
jgi:calcium-dependent protein kinase